MSNMRPGTADAITLLDCADNDIWKEELERYQTAVKFVADKKKKKELVALDQWLWNEYPTEVRSREPKYVTAEELSKVMKWKLIRGKFRPALQGLVEQNSEKTVTDISRQSLSMLESGDWKNSIKKMSELRGVGPATASAVLAPLCSSLSVPFMADEVLEATRGRPRDYTIGAYEEMRDVLTSLSKSLEPNGAWTAESLGKALWTRAMLGEKLPQSSTAGADDDVVGDVLKSKRSLDDAEESKKKYSRVSKLKKR